MELKVGTSGFSYDAWRGEFYPSDLPKERFLEHYAARLSCVELNNTFYRMPSAEGVAKWRDAVPDGFRFSVKASRRITHLGRLKAIEQPLELLLDRMSVFGDRLGIVLFQLPPNFKCDNERLASLLSAVAGRVPVALEFRHASWFEQPTLDLLREHDATLCIGDPEKDEFCAPLIRTAERLYVRLRQENYSERQLTQWRDQLRELGGTECFVFFKHETLGPSYAQQLQRLW